MRLIQHPSQFRIAITRARRRLDHGVEFAAEIMDAHHGVALRPGTLPLVKIPAMVGIGVPGTTPYRHLPMRTKAIQILVDEGRAHIRMAGANFMQRLVIEIGPEIGFLADIAKPAAVIAIGGSRHQRRKITPLGALVQLVIEPAVIHAGKLRIGQFAIADDDHHLLAAVFGDMRPIAQLLPIHIVNRINIFAIDHHIAIAGALQVRNQTHVKTHFRRPEAIETVAPEQVAGNGLPAADLLIPVGFRNQRHDRMVITGAENLEQAFILQMPEHLAAIDDPVHALLKGRIGQGLQQRPGQGQMHTGNILIIPERSWHAIVGEQDFPRLPFVMVKQIIEIARRLVHIQHQSVINLLHRASPRNGDLFCGR